jgi:hypothetical protein
MQEIESPTPHSRKAKNLSTPSKIIIQSHEQSYVFDKRSYNQEFLQGIITKLEWEGIVSEASRVMGVCWSKKKIHDQIKLPKFMIISALVSVILIMIYMITLYIAATTDEESTALLIVAITSISIGTVIAGVMATYNFKRKLGKFLTLDEFIKIDLDIHLNGLNQKYKNKLEFIYIPSNRWIEVNILDRRNINLINADEERKKFIVRDNYRILTEADKMEENGAIPT